MGKYFSYTLLITWLLLTVSCKTNLVPTSSRTENFRVSEEYSKVDSQVVQLYLPFKNILEKDMKRVISISEKEMIKNRPESYLTNLLADLLLEEAKIVSQKNHLNVIPEISYFNYGGIRTFLPQGEITVGKIFELMPFENELVYLQLSGMQIKEFLNQIAKNGGDSIGGTRFVISNNTATKIQINGNKLEPNKNYWLVTNDYVAAGGDDLSILTERSEFLKSGQKIRDLIIQNLEKRHNAGELLTAQLDGRISHE